MADARSAYPEGARLWVPERFIRRTGAPRNSINWFAICRLHAAVIREQAVVDLGTVARRIRENDPVALYSYGVGVRPLQEFVVGDDVTDYESQDEEGHTIFVVTAAEMTATDWPLATFPKIHAPLAGSGRRGGAVASFAPPRSRRAARNDASSERAEPALGPCVRPEPARVMVGAGRQTTDRCRVNGCGCLSRSFASSMIAGTVLLAGTPMPVAAHGTSTGAQRADLLQAARIDDSRPPEFEVRSERTMSDRRLTETLDTDTTLRTLERRIELPITHLADADTSAVHAGVFGSRDALDGRVAVVFWRQRAGALTRLGRVTKRLFFGSAFVFLELEPDDVAAGDVIVADLSFNSGLIVEAGTELDFQVGFASVLSIDAPPVADAGRRGAPAVDLVDRMRAAAVVESDSVVHIRELVLVGPSHARLRRVKQTLGMTVAGLVSSPDSARLRLAYAYDIFPLESPFGYATVVFRRIPADGRGRQLLAESRVHLEDSSHVGFLDVPMPPDLVAGDRFDATFRFDTLWKVPARSPGGFVRLLAAWVDGEEGF